MKLSWFLSDGGHGYATVGHKLHDAVTAAGAESLAEYRSDWDALIVVHPPTRGYLVGPGQRPDVIFHTMVESNRLPTLWRNVINRTGAVWVPSTFCEQVFRDGGVTVPIIRTGYAVEGTPICREEHDGPFRVLAWGDSLASRKNVLLAIQAFIDANLPDATLDVKLNLGDYPIPNAEWVDSSGKAYPNIRVYHAQWPHTMVIDWLRSGDVGIYLSGGEGYGLMPKEMMATGLPIISVINTGMCDYLTPDDVLYVPSDRLVASPFFDRSYRETGFLAHQPDVEAAVSWLRWAYHNRGELYDIGYMAGKAMVVETWESIGRAAYEQMADHVALRTWS